MGFIYDCFRYTMEDFKEKARILKEGCYGMLPTMFDVPPVLKKGRIHQSELPISLCEQILEFVTYEGEVVLDSFAGSGVVGEAALNTKRNCILIELLKDNINKIKNRLGSKIYFERVFE